MSTKQTENYLRLHLLNNEAITVLRSTFLNIVDETCDGDVDIFLSEFRHDILRQLRSKAQRDVLFPGNGRTDINQWDVSLLCFILLSCCTLEGKIGINQLRALMESQVSAHTDIDGFLGYNKAIIDKMKMEGVIDEVQYDILYPKANKSNLNDWDLNLLLCILAQFSKRKNKQKLNELLKNCIFRDIKLYNKGTPDLTLYLKLKEKKCKEMCQKEIIQKDQLNQLFPKEGESDINTWDAHLLQMFVLNVCAGLKRDSIVAIKVVKQIRNEMLAHKGFAEMETGEFLNTWTKLFNAIEVIVEEEVPQMSQEWTQKCEALNRHPFDISGAIGILIEYYSIETSEFNSIRDALQDIHLTIEMEKKQRVEEHRCIKEELAQLHKGDADMAESMQKLVYEKTDIHRYTAKIDLECTDVKIHLASANESSKSNEVKSIQEALTRTVGITTTEAEMTSLTKFSTYSDVKKEKVMYTVDMALQCGEDIDLPLSAISANVPISKTERSPAAIPLSDALILNLSGKLENEWKTVMLALGLKYENFQKKYKDTPDAVQLQIISALDRWRSSCDPSMQAEQLCQALESANRHDLAEEFRKENHNTHSNKKTPQMPPKSDVTRQDDCSVGKPTPFLTQVSLYEPCLREQDLSDKETIEEKQTKFQNLPSPNVTTKNILKKSLNVLKEEHDGIKRSVDQGAHGGFNLTSVKLVEEITERTPMDVHAPLYTITVSTGKKSKAVTDANVFIVFYGKEKANHKKITIPGGNLKLGEAYTLTTEIPFVVTCVKVGHDNTGNSPDWFCERINVLCQETGMEKVFPCRKWLSKTNGDADIVRTIYEQQAITKQVLHEMCKRYGRKSPEVVKACEEIRLQILSWSMSFKDVWATYKSAAPDCIVFVVFSEKGSDRSLPPIVKTFDIIQRTINEYSKEDHVTRKTEICQFSKCEKEDRKNLTDILQKNGSKLMDTHSNLNIITLSPVKSKQFTLGTHRVKRKPCIICYVCIKGYIPIQEEELPPVLGKYKTDVREGAFIFYNDPEQYMQRLKMGCSIGKHTNEQGLGGTLGAFVDLPYGQIGCITSAHTLFTREELLQSDGRKRDNPYVEPTIYQPAPTLVPICATNNPFGHISSIVYRKGEKRLTGVEAAIITITDSSRHPDSGTFPKFDKGLTEETQLNYTSGDIFTSLPDNINDYMFYKYGAKTGLTSGEITSDGAIVRTSGSLEVRDECELHNQIEISLVGSTPLAKPGDSGALVLLAPKDNPNDLRALGIVTGGNTLYQVFYVTPIWEILRALNLPLKLKKFECPTRMIKDYECQVQERDTQNISPHEIESHLNQINDTEIGSVDDKIGKIKNEVETVKSRIGEVEGKVDAIRFEMSTKTDLNQMATKTDLDQMATKTDIDQMATRSDLNQMATKTDLDQMATKTDLDQMATKTDLNQMVATTISAISAMENRFAQYFPLNNASHNKVADERLDDAGDHS